MPAHRDFRACSVAAQVPPLSKNSVLEGFFNSGFSCRLSKKKFDPAFFAVGC